MRSNYNIIEGDCLTTLPSIESNSIQCCITSPPYWGLRDYGVENQLGLEPTPNEYVCNLVKVFKEVFRVLKPDGTLWLNIGDSYSSGTRKTQVVPTLRTTTNDSASGKQAHLNGIAVRPPCVEGLGAKQLVGIPWRVAFALQEAGWCLRQDIIWHKPNPMPESVLDRCTRSHEFMFLLTKNIKYYFDNNAIKEPARNWGTRDRSKMRSGTTDPKLKHGGLSDCDFSIKGKNKRDVWSINTSHVKGAHFATFPVKLVEPCILAGSKEGDTILDPFNGSGTVGLVSLKHKRNYIGIELNPMYIELSHKRISVL